MKTVNLADVPVLQEALRNGESLQIVDGDTPIAEVVPMPAPNAKGKLPDDFFTRPRPKIPGVSRKCFANAARAVEVGIRRRLCR